MDGISISTAAITALLGGGGLASLVTAAVMRRGNRDRCNRCPDHQRLVAEVSALKVSTAEDIASIKADIRNICRSLDEMRTDVRDLAKSQFAAQK